MFKQSNLYSSFDEKGFPTADASGNPLSKSLQKKLSKDYEKQQHLHEQWKEANCNSNQ